MKSKCTNWAKDTTLWKMRNWKKKRNLKKKKETLKNEKFKKKKPGDTKDDIRSDNFSYDQVTFKGALCE